MNPTQAASAPAWTHMMPIVLMFLIFYFLLIRPQQKKMKQHKQLLANVKVGDKVLYTKWGGNEVKVGHEEWKVVKQTDILAIVE